MATPMIDGTTSDALRVEFTVENLFGGGMSFAEIKIYNLNRANRNILISRKSRDNYDLQKIDFYAGYEGSCFSIFSGNIVNAFKNSDDGVNHVVTLYCTSAPANYDTARIEKVFGNNTPANDVIKFAAESFGLPAELYGDFPFKYIKGMSLSTDSKEAMKELANEFNFDWQIENGKVVIVKDGEERTTSVKEVNQDDLLLGGTEITYTGCVITTLLDASFRPYTPVKVTTSNAVANYSGAYFDYSLDTINEGTYKVLQVTHKGDFTGETWETRSQCLR